MSPTTLPSDRPLDGLGRALETLRQRRGLSRGALARAAGVSSETVGRWEKGESHPSLRVLEALLAALGAHLGDLFAAQVAAWHEPLHGWPENGDSASLAAAGPAPVTDSAASAGASPAPPGQIAWLELRARVGRLHRQLERLEAALHGESVAQAKNLVQSLAEAGAPSPGPGPVDLAGELAAAAEKLRELHNILQVEPKAALDLLAEYADPDAAAVRRRAED